MAGIDVLGRASWSVNTNINMVPFIDLLMVTITFLLITAVWVNQHSRIEANAQVPGSLPTEQVDPYDVPVDLHVFAHENEFVLAWKQGATVISETRLPRQALSDGDVDHSELASKTGEEFERHGSNKDADSKCCDIAIMHTGNALPFCQLVAMMDAINTTKRPWRDKGGKLQQVPAFKISFAAR
jgi:hypothetical protein